MGVLGGVSSGGGSSLLRILFSFFSFKRFLSKQKTFQPQPLHVIHSVIESIFLSFKGKPAFLRETPADFFKVF